MWKKIVAIVLLLALLGGGGFLIMKQRSVRQQEAARSFAALAGDFSDWSETFSRMGRDSRSMLERITRLLRTQMR